MPAGIFTFEIQLNFLDHTLELTTSTGVSESFPLTDGLSVPDFYKKVFAMLSKLDIHPKIIATPFRMPDRDPMTTPFRELTQFSSYNADYVRRFWQIVLWTAGIFNEFNGKFYGKASNAQIFWHNMDLAVTRFCGRRGPQLPDNSNIVTKEAYSHEMISFGFWAGDDIVRDAAFYSQSFPSPPGIDKIRIEPASAKWSYIYSNDPMALLMYNDLLTEKDPKQAVLHFLESCYTAGAKLLKWDIADMEVLPLNKM
jgi:hypothetical protein